MQNKELLPDSIFIFRNCPFAMPLWAGVGISTKVSRLSSVQGTIVNEPRGSEDEISDGCMNSTEKLKLQRKIKIFYI